MRDRTSAHTPLPIRRKITVEGNVQGVGFRPFVYRIARQFSLSGYVENNPAGVTIEVEGQAGRVKAFLDELRQNPPRLAFIAAVRETEAPIKGDTEFQITASRTGGERTVWISPDTCVCDDCLREMDDSADRRHRYAFINCTNCGPRYTIISDIPYDRPKTTMKSFPMCDECRREYENPSDRRFHAQPVACSVCGPEIFLLSSDGRRLGDGWPSIVETAKLLKDGAIVSVKGLGGFHLAVDATNATAVERLRSRKRREEKPLAVMARDMDHLRQCVEVNATSERLLVSIRRPIVLLPKRHLCAIAEAVAPRSKCHGMMLPYAPLHFLLLHPQAGGPPLLVMTSGNVTEEPIVTENDEALQRLKGIADFFLTHNRDIYIRTDDSVVSVVRDREVVWRRSRGYVPLPILLGLPAGDEVLAVGPELKNTVCITRGGTAILSQHVGDIKNMETYASLEKTVTHLERIMEVKPAAIAHDMHPLYMSTQYARERASRDGLPLVPVLHHHAHIAACMAENGCGADEKVIGVAYDGTGYGADGAIWGGEILISTYTDARRQAHLDYVPMPGGDAAVEQSWRMALAHLTHLFPDDAQLAKSLEMIRRYSGGSLVAMGEDEIRVAQRVRQMIHMNVNCPLTSSMGRFFDAASALVGVCRVGSYEGQPAIEFEGALDDAGCGFHPCPIDTSHDPWLIPTRPVIQGILGDMARGETPGRIAAKFHNTVVAFTVEVCEHARREHGLKTVALSGGCFMNRYLSQHLEPALEDRGFRVLAHSQVPPNDGGVALGQAVIAKYRMASRARPPNSPAV
jgi:hydrogenase maturation protein HypF